MLLTYKDTVRWKTFLLILDYINAYRIIQLHIIICENYGGLKGRTFFNIWMQKIAIKFCLKIF